MIMRLFREHPESVGETYFEHMRMALGFSGQMFLGSLACLTHAFLPFLCKRTGSDAILALHARMTCRRPSPAPAEDPEQRAITARPRA